MKQTMCISVHRCWERCVESVRSHYVGWHIWCRPMFMSEQYFFVRKLGLGKKVVSLSLVVTEVSRGGGMR